MRNILSDLKLSNPEIYAGSVGDTTVVNIKRGESFDVYIGRPSVWGNPFYIGRQGLRSDCLAKYKLYILATPELLTRLHELRGKRLGCYCAPLLCHGHVLAEIADALPTGGSSDLSNI